MKIPQGYKQTEVGIIPEDWEVKQISEFTDIITGGTPNTSLPEYWDGDIKWMNSGELNLKFVKEVEGRITNEGLNNSSTHLIPTNCVLIGLAGQGKTRGTAAFNLIPLCTNQSIAAILPSNEHNSLYLYYVVDSLYEYLRLLSSGDGGRGGLNKNLLNSLQIKMPKSIEEQRRIADVLSDVDGLITALDKKIAKKKLIKQATMQQLLTGKKRLQGFTDEWKTKKMGDIVDVHKGEQINRSLLFDNAIGYPVMNGGISPSGYYQKSNCTGKTIIISEGGNSCGYVNYMNTPFWVGGHCYVVVPRIDVDLVFLYTMLKFKEEEIMALRTGSGLPNIKKSRLLDELSLKVPTLIHEQQAIATILSDMDKEISDLERKHDKYKLLKNGMMQKLLTGQIRIK